MLAAIGGLVLAVQARSAPFKFMNGATATSVIFCKAPSAPNCSRHFELRADFNDVATAARAELKTTGGWRHSAVFTGYDGSQVMRSERGTDTITIMEFSRRPGVVSVALGRPPTLGDRFAWLIVGTEMYPP